MEHSTSSTVNPRFGHSGRLFLIFTGWRQRGEHFQMLVNSVCVSVGAGVEGWLDPPSEGTPRSNHPRTIGPPRSIRPRTPPRTDGLPFYSPLMIGNLGALSRISEVGRQFIITK